MIASFIVEAVGNGAPALYEKSGGSAAFIVSAHTPATPGVRAAITSSLSRKVEPARSPEALDGLSTGRQTAASVPVMNAARFMTRFLGSAADRCAKTHRRQPARRCR